MTTSKMSYDIYSHVSTDNIFIAQHYCLASVKSEDKEANSLKLKLLLSISEKHLKNTKPHSFQIKGEGNLYIFASPLSLKHND